jgi:hypothetical protein
MSEELNLHVVGSFTRTASMQTLFRPKYRICLEAKVTDTDGSPIEGLKAENFTIRLAGLESSDLGDFLFTPSTDNTLFPGFYRFTKERSIDGIFGFDLYLLAGLLFCIRVDFEQKFATIAINLTQIVLT